MPTPDNRTEEIAQTLELNQTKAKSSLIRWLYVLAVVVVINLALIAYIQYASKNSQLEYETKAVAVGALNITVSATGNLKPTNTVNVGTELSGTVKNVYVDDNDAVKKGDLLAVLDRTKLRSKVASSNAALESAMAGLHESDIALADALNELNRAKKMRASSGGKLPSDKEMDALQTAYERAHARRDSAKAKVKQARSALSADDDDLSKSAIVSPIDGIILVRNIEPGQTVAAALQTPVLFSIAENLSQMDLVVSVDEADIGSVKEGQPASFSVDAYPDRTFKAAIDKVKLNSQIVDGVVTYESTLKVDNRDELLRPGMTATAEITVKEVTNALLVPNAALRYRPSTEGEEERDDTEYVWVLIDNKTIKTKVYSLGTDGVNSAVEAAELMPGHNVITAEKTKAK